MNGISEVDPRIKSSCKIGHIFIIRNNWNIKLNGIRDIARINWRWSGIILNVIPNDCKAFCA